MTKSDVVHRINREIDRRKTWRHPQPPVPAPPTVWTFCEDSCAIGHSMCVADERMWFAWDDGRVTVHHLDDLADALDLFSSRDAAAQAARAAMLAKAESSPSDPA